MSILSVDPRRQTRSFKALRMFNRLDVEERRRLARLDRRVAKWTLRHFTKDSLTHRLIRALANERAMDFKEIVESFEFVERVRRRLRAPIVVDSFCGHGFTGVLLALLERRVNHVYLIDRTRPPSHERVMNAVRGIAPWIDSKITFIEADFWETQQTFEQLSPGGSGFSLLAVHACGVRTDRVLDVAIRINARVAVMPCCYFQTAVNTPRALQRALGRATATDVDRTYRLEEAGFEVDWSAIPDAITPMNRILIGLPRENSSGRSGNTEGRTD